MQGEKITKRILEDAQVKKSQMIENAQKEAEDIINLANEFVENEKKQIDQKIEEYKSSVKDKYDTLLKIEGNKIILNIKQKILEDLKIKATDFLANLKKLDALKFLEKLIKTYAKKDETVLFNLKDVEGEDIESLKAVKELNLTVKKSKLDGYGIVISNKDFDKNLLFSSLVSNAFEEKEGKIGKILF